MTRRARRLGWSLLLPVALLVAYQLWARGAGDPYFPTLPTMLSAFRSTWLGDGFTEDILPSLRNLALGYVGGVLLGLLGGIALGRVPLLRRGAAPLVAFALALPPIALLPLFLIVIGVGPGLQVGVIAWAVFFHLLVNTADGLARAEPLLLDVSRTYRINPLRRLFLVLLPSAAPQILGAMRAALSVAVLVMVVSEMIGASRGIGAVTLLSQQDFQYDRMWAGMLLLAALGYLLNLAFTVAERTVFAPSGLVPSQTPGERS